MALCLRTSQVPILGPAHRRGGAPLPFAGPRKAQSCGKTDLRKQIYEKYKTGRLETMSQIKLARWIKTVLTGLGICGLLLYGGVIPSLGQSFVDMYPELSGNYVPWLVFLLLTAIPCYLFLIFGWKIATNIGKDRSFCMDNARYLQTIAHLTADFSLWEISYCGWRARVTPVWCLLPCWWYFWGSRSPLRPQPCPIWWRRQLSFRMKTI